MVEAVLLLEQKLCRKPKKRDDNSLYVRARNIFGSWNNLMKAAGYEVKFYQKVSNTKINHDFYYFLGLLITDGHIYYNQKAKRYKVAIYTSYPEERDMILTLIKHLFNYNASFSSKMVSFNKKPNYEIRISSRKLAEFLIKDWQIPSGAKSSIVRVPQKVKESSHSLQKEFIKGVIDGDGSISRIGVKIASGSIAFLEDLKELLNSLEINTGSLIKERETTFTIRINKKCDILRLKKIYSDRLSYPRKKQTMDKI